MKGQVIKSTGSWYVVKGHDGLVYDCRLRGRFKTKGIRANNPIAVGDWVEIRKETHQEAPDGKRRALIEKIFSRDNYIIRKSTRKTGFAHLMASNIDQALLIATITFPRTSVGFIDRFLVSAECFRIPAAIVFNKEDLLNQQEITFTNELMALYETLGYQTARISVKAGEGLEKVKALLKDKTTFIAGHSGVGKSTLLNALIPGLAQKTGEVSAFANKGIHTTTFAEMFELDNDTKIVDSPGIKSLGLVDIEPYELSHYFPEMKYRLGTCKFNNCLHTNEPGCKVIEDLKSGRISSSRYRSYLSMLEGHDNRG